MLKEQLSEAYIFDDGQGGLPPQSADGMDMQQGMPPQGEGQAQPGESEEEKKMRMQSIIQHEPIIMKMREIALEGLQKYSDNPTSSLYEFFKKVFLDSDKVLTDGAGGGK